MKKKLFLLCGVLSFVLLFASCGNKAEKKDEAPVVSPSTGTTVQPADNTDYGQYDIKENTDDTLTVKITPKADAAEALETEVTYTFKDEKITSVNYKSKYATNDAAKAIADKYKAEAAMYSNVSVSGNVVTYSISKSSMSLYEGMTRQDITELTKILNGGQ